MEFLASILAGGATGLLGTAITGVMGYFERKQRHAQEMELRKIDMQIAKSEAASAERVAAIEAESAESAAQWRALEGSYNAATKRWGSGDSPWLTVVDVVRGLMRPVLTLGSLILVAVIYFYSDIPVADDMQVQIINTSLYISTTCVLWWFGSRPHKPHS